MDATAAFRQQPAAQAAAVRLGVVVHPSRAVDGPLRELRRWAALHCGALVQIAAAAIGRPAGPTTVICWSRSAAT